MVPVREAPVVLATVYWTFPGPVSVVTMHCSMSGKRKAEVPVIRMKHLPDVAGKCQDEKSCTSYGVQ